MILDRPTVVQTEELDADAAAWLGERCDLVRFDRERLKTINGQFSQARGLVVRTYTQVDENLLEHFPNLKVVGRAGVGLENIDVAACTRRGIEVVHTPDANTSAVAEYVFSLIFESIRPRLFLREPVSSETWCDLRKTIRAPRQLCEMTIGILGLGRVGSRVARAAAGFGTQVLFHDIERIAPDRRHGATEVDPKTLFAQADILSIHVDARPTNEGLIGADLLGLLKPHALLINTSRGRVIQAGALAEFLSAHPAARAMLDVHPQEPFDGSYPLTHLPNAFLSPHIAAATTLANRNMSWVVEDVWRVLTGATPHHAAVISK